MSKILDSEKSYVCVNIEGFEGYTEFEALLKYIKSLEKRIEEIESRQYEEDRDHAAY